MTHKRKTLKDKGGKLPKQKIPPAPLSIFFRLTCPQKGQVFCFTYRRLVIHCHCVIFAGAQQGAQ